MKDYYRILGVPENAHEQDIKLAYRRLAKQFHPDLNPGDKKAEEKFKEIVEAYNTLSDSLLRSAYDRKWSGRDLFYKNSSFFYSDPKEEKKDPRRKEYSKEDFDHAKKVMREKELVRMKRRKKILTGMIVTFIFYLIATGSFQYWLDKKKQEDEDSMKKELSVRNSKNEKIEKQNIDVLDSPYDSLFGAGVYVPYCPNNLVIFNHFSDAVICAVQASPPYKTIRNEFSHPAIDPIVLRDLPNGSYYIKIYAGSSWNMKQKIPNGKMLGGFRFNESFYKIHAGPFNLVRPTHEHLKNEHTSDTIWIDPKIMSMDTIWRDDFFSPGEK